MEFCKKKYDENGPLLQKTQLIAAKLLQLNQINKKVKETHLKRPI